MWESPEDSSSEDAESATGGREVLRAAREAAGAVDVLEVGSTGVRGIEPLLLVTGDGRTEYYPEIDPEGARRLVERAESGGEIGEAEWSVEHEPAVRTLPTPTDGPLAVGKRRVLGGCGWTDPESGDAAVDGAAEFARSDPEAALERLGEVGLLGRGRGDASQDAPVADDLRTVREGTGDPVVVVNANESDRRNETDGTLLGGSPDRVLDGALAVAAIVGADPDDVVVYGNENDDLVSRRVRRAAASVTDALEERTTAPQVVAGPDEYVAGEFTMALEALEGSDRLEARLRPPGPARHGLYGRPTAVYTPRTLAQVRAALVDPDGFGGADADPGTRLVTVSGDVAAPATIELETGASLAEVRDAVDVDGPVKAACVGGQFGGFVRSLELAFTAPALSSADLGTGGAVELFDGDRCVVASVGDRVRFASEENCGRCFPGREGSKQLLSLLRDVYGGDYEDEMLLELAGTMEGSSLCEFGQSTGRCVRTALDRFDPVFQAHAAGRCPSGACEVSS